ncbi:MAG: hypothetical protein KDD29_11390, partial [Flavobacteriales bacterium]|nr:hypothetical protein [Flavobacteriales bacterium]
IFEKNLIALGVSLIVIKYAFLILIIYLIISTKMVDVVSFMVGISTAILAGIVYFTRTFLVGIRKKE